MHSSRFVVAVVVALGVFIRQAPAPAQQPPMIALVGGTLIDGSGGEPIENSVVLVREERIESVGTMETLPVPAGYEVIASEGMTVMPGLWDMHVHLLYAGHTSLQYWHNTYTDRFEREIMPATAGQLLMAGVTSARDMGAPPDAIFSVKARIARGELEGPTLYAVGPQLTPPPPTWAQHYRWSVSNPDQARTNVRALLDTGADLLKVSGAEMMSVDAIRAIADEAHAGGKLVAAHGRTDDEIRLGLAAGVDDFQHIGVGEASAEYPANLMSAIRTRVSAGPPLYWTPTVGLSLNREYLGQNPEMLDDPSAYRGLPAVIAADVREAAGSFRPQAVDAATIRRKFAQLQEAGVELLVGTDAGLAGAPHSQALWQELDAWVRILGVDPMAAIRRATYYPAVAMGVEQDVGTIDEGKLADIIAVRGDPLRHIDVLLDPAIVIRHGRRHK